MQVDIGRRDDASIHFDDLVGSERLDFALLQDTQQFHLQVQRHLADFIEKQSTAVGDPELALAALAVRAGIGAGRGAEEFRFNQRIRNGRDVDADEWLVGTRRGVVNGLGQQLLAGAGFTGQQHRHVLPRRPAGKLLGLRNSRGRADIVVEGKPRRARLRQLPFRHAQVAFEPADPGQQRLEAFEMIVEHEADRADDVLVLVLDRHARDDQPLLAEFHDVEQNWFAGLGDAAHQAVRDDFLDRAADRFRGVTKAERRKILLVDIDDAAAAIDGDGAFAQVLQPLEQRLHGARANFLRGADHERVIGHLPEWSFGKRQTKFVSLGDHSPWLLGPVPKNITRPCSAHSRARGNPGQQAPEFAAPGSPLSRGRAGTR